MSVVVYEERAPLSKVIVILISLGFCLLFFTLVNSLIHAPPRTSAYLFLILLLYLLVSFGYMNMKFRVTSLGIEAVYPPLTYKVPFREIERVEVIESLPKSIGWGLRLWIGRIAFVSIHGKAIKVKKRGGIFKTLIFTPSNVEEFMKYLLDFE